MFVVSSKPGQMSPKYTVMLIPWSVIPPSHWVYLRCVMRLLVKYLPESLNSEDINTSCCMSITTWFVWNIRSLNCWSNLPFLGIHLSKYHLFAGLSIFIFLYICHLLFILLSIIYLSIHHPSVYSPIHVSIQIQFS